jgi:hypothetical protein
MGNTYSDMPEINYEEYIGKEVSIFLNDLNKTYTYFFFRDEPPGTPRGGLFYFGDPDDCFILINISTFNYVQVFEDKSNWQFDDFLKEKISSIGVRLGRKDNYQFRVYPSPATPNGNAPNFWHFFYGP